MNSPDHTPGSTLTFWGFLLALIGLAVGGAAWNEGDGSWVPKARDAALIGGPILVAGVLLIVGGFVVAAIHAAEGRRSDQSLSATVM